MHVHTVFFWLKPDVSEAQGAAFFEAVKALGDVASVRDCQVGTPIASERAVVDDTFSFSLHLRFDDTAGHDAYQVDPLHEAFVDNWKALWDKVLVYDSCCH